jgi:hypothetical protein
MLSFTAAAEAAETKLVSTNTTGATSANAYAEKLAITPDGRYAVYTTAASDATTGNAGGVPQVIRHDLQTGEKALISVDTGGGAGNAFSGTSDISDDGRYVAFESAATDLVAGDPNDTTDVFLRDVQAGTTLRLSAGSGSGGGRDPQISADGRYVFFTTPNNDLRSPDEDDSDWDLFRYDQTTQEREALTPSNGLEGWAGDTNLRFYVITPDGRYVVFAAENTNLATLPDGQTWPAGISHIFRLDTTDDSVALVDASPAGAPGNGDATFAAVTPDGGYVAFVSSATNLDPAVNDTGTNTDVFRRDMTAGVTVLSRTPEGAPGDRHSSWSPTTARARIISDNGRYVAFTTAATNFFPNVTNGFLPDDVVLADAENGTLELVNERYDESQSANGTSFYPAISADGRYVGFASRATDLYQGAPFDGNGEFDIFRYDRQLDAAELISISADGNSTGFGASLETQLDSTGRYVFFSSSASNLVASDSNSATDFFRRDAGVSVSDTDGDGVADDVDNCPSDANADQVDTDGDTDGDACDSDDDDDTVLDVSDNCRLVQNTDQANTDSDAEGDACDADDDNDTVLDGSDNCQLVANETQTDTDGDAQGNACDADDDNDGVADETDNCQLVANQSQTDTDGDSQGNACDADDDNDGVADTADGCPLVAAGTADGCPDETVPPDTTAPTVSITSGPKAKTKDKTPTFTFTSNDPTARFTCSIDGKPAVSCTSPHTTSKLKKGKHTFAVVAIDPAGNASSPDTQTFTVKKKKRKRR